LITASGNLLKLARFEKAAAAIGAHHAWMTSSRRQLLRLGGTVLASAAISPAQSEAVYVRDRKGRSAFLIACLESNQAEKEALLKRGLQLDLHEAGAAGDTARVEHLLARSPGSANHRDLEDATPLHWAAACGQVAMANLLLMKGADLGAGAEGLDNATPAHFAASVADHEAALQMLETLVGNGAPAGAPQTDGTTPLHIAARHGHADAVRLLIRRGADPIALETATGDAVAVLRDASSIVRDCDRALQERGNLRLAAELDQRIRHCRALRFRENQEAVRAMQGSFADALDLG
jgi:ankyrin repeat protein